MLLYHSCPLNSLHLWSNYSSAGIWRSVIYSLLEFFLNTTQLRIGCVWLRVPQSTHFCVTDKTQEENATNFLPQQASFLIGHAKSHTANCVCHLLNEFLLLWSSHKAARNGVLTLRSNCMNKQRSLSAGSVSQSSCCGGGDRCKTQLSFNILKTAINGCPFLVLNVYSWQLWILDLELRRDNQQSLRALVPSPKRSCLPSSPSSLLWECQ